MWPIAELGLVRLIVADQCSGRVIFMGQSVY